MKIEACALTAGAAADAMAPYPATGLRRKA